jgi:hypothetical protein
MDYQRLVFAGSKPPDGGAVLAIGLVMLVISIVEIVVSRQRPARVSWPIGALAGRLLVITVWVMMIVSGTNILLR